MKEYPTRRRINNRRRTSFKPRMRIEQRGDNMVMYEVETKNVRATWPKGIVENA